MLYGYARVSTRTQNLDRQLASIRERCPDARLYTDKQSGKDMDRPGYQELKSVLQPGDELYVHALDRLGRNKDEIKDEVRWFRAHGVKLRILNVPTTLTEFPDGYAWVADMVDNILIEVLGAMAQQEREEMLVRQREGIEAMPVVDGRRVSARTGRGFGRPVLDVDCERLPGENVKEACKRLGISRSAWYNRMRAVHSG